MDSPPGHRAVDHNSLDASMQSISYPPNNPIPPMNEKHKPTLPEGDQKSFKLEGTVKGHLVELPEKNMNICSSIRCSELGLA